MQVSRSPIRMTSPLLHLLLRCQRPWLPSPRAQMMSATGLLTEALHFPPQVACDSFYLQHPSILHGPGHAHWSRLDSPLPPPSNPWRHLWHTFHFRTPCGEYCCLRQNVTKALAGTSLGQHQENLVMITYKVLIKPFLSSAAPVSGSLMPLTLQVIQNSALRIATGFLKMAPWEHLHLEMTPARL